MCFPEPSTKGSCWSLRPQLLGVGNCKGAGASQRHRCPAQQTRPLLHPTHSGLRESLTLGRKLRDSGPHPHHGTLRSQEEPVIARAEAANSSCSQPDAPACPPVPSLPQGSLQRPPPTFPACLLVGSLLLPACLPSPALALAAAPWAPGAVAPWTGQQSGVRPDLGLSAVGPREPGDSGENQHTLFFPGGSPPRAQQRGPWGASEWPASFQLPVRSPFFPGPLSVLASAHGAH